MALSINNYLTFTSVTLTLTTIMEQAGMEAEDMEKMLFDLEIGFLHRTIWTMLCLHFDPRVSHTTYHDALHNHPHGGDGPLHLPNYPKYFPSVVQGPQLIQVQ